MIKYGQLFCLLCGRHLKDEMVVATSDGKRAFVANDDNGLCQYSDMLEGTEQNSARHLPSYPSNIQNLLQSSLTALMLERNPSYPWPKILADEMCWALKVLANADNKDDRWDLNGPVHPDDMEDE